MKLRWNQEEVVSYLEYKFEHDTITEDELEMYLDFVWNGVFDREGHLYTYKKVLYQMKKRYYNK